MTQEARKPGQAPHYKGDGVAIWKNKDKNGEVYLSVVVLGGVRVNCFKYEPKAVKNDTADKSSSIW